MVMKVGSRISVPLDDVPVRSGPIGVVRAPVDLDATLPIGQPANFRKASQVLPMRCLRCQGTVERGAAPVRVERNGYRLAWEEVPAWICGRCELAYFEPREVETVRRALSAVQALAKI